MNRKYRIPLIALVYWQSGLFTKWNRNTKARNIYVLSRNYRKSNGKWVYTCVFWGIHMRGNGLSVNKLMYWETRVSLDKCIWTYKYIERRNINSKILARNKNLVKIETHLFRNWPHPQTLHHFSCLPSFSLLLSVPSKQLSKSDLHILWIFTLTLQCVCVRVWYEVLRVIETKRYKMKKKTGEYSNGQKNEEKKERSIEVIKHSFVCMLIK